MYILGINQKEHGISLIDQSTMCCEIFHPGFYIIRDSLYKKDPAIIYMQFIS